MLGTVVRRLDVLAALQILLVAVRFVLVTNHGESHGHQKDMEGQEDVQPPSPLKIFLTTANRLCLDCWDTEIRALQRRDR